MAVVFTDGMPKPSSRNQTDEFKHLASAQGNGASRRRYGQTTFFYLYKILKLPGKYLMASRLGKQLSLSDA